MKRSAANQRAGGGGGFRLSCVLDALGSPRLITGVRHSTMHLTRCQDQKRQTLEEFYTEPAQSEAPVSREGGETMLELLAALRALPDERWVFGLTSHYRLCLLAQDTSRSPWFVIISALDQRNYFIEYLMPASVAPWPHAYVRGEARSEEEAVNMILAAMEESEGWDQKP